MIDCLIIGAGPAGLTAGIYLRRFHRAVVIVDSGQSRAKKIPLSNNYPGFPEGINGRRFLTLLRQQLEKFGGSIMEGMVTSVKKISDDEFSAEVDGKAMSAKTILFATGVVDIEPDLSGYEDIKDSGLVRFCPICDGFEFTDHRIGIIGNGQHGVRECEFIRNFSDRLSYITLESQTKKTVKAAQNLRRANINLLNGSGARLYAGAENKNVYFESADGTVHEFDIIYCALGSQVRSTLALDLGAVHDENKNLVVNEHLETSIKGFFAAGDVVSSLDQLAVATGQAAIASTAIHNRLNSM